MPEAVRVRFAPSPTGYLHVGGAHQEQIATQFPAFQHTVHGGQE